MDVLMNPFLIDKVFEFLGNIDIHQCQYVCKTWHKCAVSKLRRCPPLDDLRIVVSCEEWSPDQYSDDKDEDAVKQKVYLVSENRTINRVEFNEEESPLRDKVHDWYIHRGPVSCVLPKFEICGAIKNFLTSDARCYPGFSLLRYDQKLDNLMNNIFFSYPTLLIRHDGLNPLDPTYTECCDSKAEIRTESTYIVRRNNYPKLHRTFHGMNIHFDGLHIDRYIPGVKIIITDWSDPESPRPDFEDSKFPIKSVLYLSTSRDENSDEKREILGLIKRFKPIPSGGLLRYSRTEDVLNYYYGGSWRYYDREDIEAPENFPMILLFDPKESKLKNASHTTISFAGEGVKSAVSIFEDLTSLHEDEVEGYLERELEKFKHTLEFSIDDDLVIGFILLSQFSYRHFSYDNNDDFSFDVTHSPHVLRVISALFPSVKLFTISLDHIPQFPSDGTPDMTFHLVRIGSSDFN